MSTQKHFAVGSLRSTGIPGEYIKFCYSCSRTVHLLDHFQNKFKYACMDCAKKIRRKLEITSSSETAKRLGVSKKTIEEMSKELLKPRGVAS